jgi:hypothetical protein
MLASTFSLFAVYVFLVHMTITIQKYICGISLLVVVCPSKFIEHSKQYLCRGWPLKRSHKIVHTFNHALSTKTRLNIDKSPRAMVG